jgi:hypothetical protein
MRRIAASPFLFSERREDSHWASNRQTATNSAFRLVLVGLVPESPAKEISFIARISFFGNNILGKTMA